MTRTKDRHRETILPDMTAILTRGERIQIRRHGERGWRGHIVRRSISFRTTGRKGSWLLGEFLHYQIRKHVPATGRAARY